MLLTATCLCGHVSLALSPRPAGSEDLSFCHCDSCRHVTGELLVSYYPIEKPGTMEGLTTFTTPDGWARFFCGVCGCHVLRSRMTLEVEEWEAATGALASTDADDEVAPFKYRHVHVEDTKDGGAAPWLSQLDRSLEDSPEITPGILTVSQTTLPASCACGRVKFFVTRPDESSALPRSNYPDLMHAYCTTDPQKIQNPSDEKWWLRDKGMKYLAGTCACRSCRLSSGFEIQTWAFIPRSNIFFQVTSHQARDPPVSTSNQTRPSNTPDRNTIPLDFEKLQGVLKSYASSPDVLRESCPRCGATVFWHDRWRPDLIDVSVGLFRAEEGSRAEEWLEWWTGRLSFSEDAEGDRGRALVDRLEEGLRVWGERNG